MNVYLAVFIGTMITFAATTLGASFVLFFKEINITLQRICMGFSSGIMIAASVWSLIIPSIELSKNKNYPSFVPALVGLFIGTMFIYLLDKIVPHIHLNEKKYEGSFFINIFRKRKLKKINKSDNNLKQNEFIEKGKLKRTTLLMTAITLHNIPEGMAIALSIALTFSDGKQNNLWPAISLVLGMSLQNIPEGAAVSLPLRQAGFSKWKAFWYGTLSGIVEPIAGMISVLLISVANIVLPYFLSFAAGAMIYVVVEELIPESHAGPKHSNVGVLTFMLGFAIMMCLDVAFA